MFELLAQAATQPEIVIAKGYTITEFVAIAGAWGIGIIAIFEIGKRVVRWLIAEWFDTKKFIRDQQAASQTNAKAILNIAEKMNASGAVESPDPSMMEPVRGVASTGTGDGGTAANPTVSVDSWSKQ